MRSEVDARKIGVQDQVQLTITVEGSGAPDEIALPPLTNLDVVGGPFQSTQVSIVNGRMSQSRSHTYVLQPRGPGKAEVGIVRVGDQAAPAIPIEVVAGSVRPSEPRRQDPFASAFGDPFEEMLGRRRGRAVAPKLLVQASPSRTRLRVGEPLVLTYWLDTQTSVADLQFKEAPQFAGFWVEDLERPQASPSGEAVTVEGETYRRFPILRKLLFPTKAGTLTLPAATFRIGLARQGFFDAGGVVERTTKPVTVTVEPLPDAPGFSGAVGRFRTSASLDRDVVPLGEAAMLRFRVEGTGNLKWIDRAPEVVAKGARVFPPQAKSDLRTTADGITGSRTWEFVVVPETSGAVEVPPLPFSWFDPSAGRIVTAETAPLALRVEGGTVAAGLPVPAPAAGAARAGGALPLRADLDRHHRRRPRPVRPDGGARRGRRPPPARRPLGSGPPPPGRPARARGLAPLGARRAAGARARGERADEQGAGRLARREGAPRGLRRDPGGRRRRGGAGGARAPRRRALRPLRAAARRVPGQGPRPRRPRGGRGAEVGMKALAARLPRDRASPGRPWPPPPPTGSGRRTTSRARATTRRRSPSTASSRRPAQESASLYWNWAQAATARGAQGEALWALLRARELDPGDRAVVRDVERLREALNLDPAEIAPEPLAAAGRFARRFRLDLVALALLALSLVAHGLVRVRSGLRAAGPVAWAALVLGLLAAAVPIAASFARPTATIVRRGAPLLDAASPTAEPTGSLREGEVVPVLEASGAWLRVEDNAGARGWAHVADARRLDAPPAPPRD